MLKVFCLSVLSFHQRSKMKVLRYPRWKSVSEIPMGKKRTLAVRVCVCCVLCSQGKVMFACCKRVLKGQQQFTVSYSPSEWHFQCYTSYTVFVCHNPPKHTNKKVCKNLHIGQIVFCLNMYCIDICTQQSGDHQFVMSHRCYLHSDLLSGKIIFKNELMMQSACSTFVNYFNWWKKKQTCSLHLPNKNVVCLSQVGVGYIKIWRFNTWQ